MGKRAQKRQKIAPPEVQPLGSVQVLDDADKDDEERHLESVLFGVPYKPSKKSTQKASDPFAHHGDGMTEEPPDADGGMELLPDSDLFFLDDGAPNDLGDSPDFAVNIDLTVDEPDGAVFDEQAASPGSSNAGDSDDDTPDNVDNDSEEAIPDVQPPSALTALPPTSRKAAAWADPDDSSIQVSLASQKRLRKLRDEPSEDVVGGRQYEAKLRKEYERINPAPEWASKARKKLHPKRRRSAVDDDQEEGSQNEAEFGVEDLLTATDGLLGPDRGRLSLPKGTLSIDRLRDANQSAKAEGEIKSLAFHPSPRVPILLTASSDRRLRLFNVDGHTNPHIQTIHIPSLPITNALFHPTGSSILLTGHRPFYYTYDLQSGTTTRSPRGLWGTTFTNSNPAKLSDMSMEICAFDPTGTVLAVAGRRGYVHLVDWKSGAGQVVGSVKMNAGVKSVWWSRSPNSRELISLGDNAEVYVWDIGERKCVRRWKDDGGFGSIVMSGDLNGRYLGIGSKTGMVNVYEADSNVTPTSTSPKLLKTLGNLTTSISTLRFNHDSQLLAIASDSKKDQMRLIHLSSLTAFGNWPTSSTPLGHVTAVDFSAGSEYLAVGNNRGRVLLYHLPDFVAR